MINGHTPYSKGRCVARPPLSRTLAFFALGLALTACATLARLRFEPPTLELAGIEITALDLSGGSFTLWLDVLNPNDYELRATRIQAELDLADTHFGSSALERSLSFPAAERTRVELPVTFTWEGVGAAARALLERGAVTYDLEARLWLGASFGGREVVIRRRGEAPILAEDP